MRYKTLAAIAPWLLAAALPAGAATISTIAGNGSPGFSDGPALAASFVFPAGVAYEPRSQRIFVADAGAQRIRMLSPGGMLTTIAGSGAMNSTGLWVAGGYQDGPAALAKFDDPLALAVNTRQTIYVADNGNHCIRKIEDGIVTTLAKSSDPTGIAVDDSDNVYVADPIDGLQEIAASGTVRHLPFGHAPLAVAVRQTGREVTLFISDADGVLVIAPDRKTFRYRSFERIPLQSSAKPAAAELDRMVEGLEPMGAPYGITALGPNHFAYTDPRASMIRMMGEGFSRMEPIAGAYSETAMAESAGYRDGPTGAALLDAPMGIAAAKNGTLVVADSGNRRLRLIKNTDLPQPVNESIFRHVDGPPHLDASRDLYLSRLKLCRYSRRLCARVLFQPRYRSLHRDPRST